MTTEMRETSWPDVTLARVFLPLAPGCEGPGFGFVMLATYLLSRGFAVDYRDYVAADPWPPTYDADRVAEFLDTTAPVLAVGGMADVLPLIICACRKVKEKRRNVKIVLGGPGPFFVEREILQHFPWIDIVVRGEAEVTMADLLDKLPGGGSLSRIDGIFYRNGSDIVQTQARRPINDLDALPVADFTLIRKVLGNVISVATSRGCPYHCNFCAAPVLWDQVRLHSVAWVREQISAAIEAYRTLGLRPSELKISFIDDTFIAFPDRAIAIVKWLVAEYPGVAFSCNGRVDLLSEDFVRTLASCGASRIGLGIESGSQNVLDRIHKGFTVSQARKAIGICKRWMPVTKLWFMWGFPFESVGDFYKTLLFIHQLNRLPGDGELQPQLQPLVPIPGTCYWREYALALRPSWEMPGPVLLPKVWLRANPDMAQIVLQYPEVFPLFYVIDSPTLGEKIALAARLWRHNEAELEEQMVQMPHFRPMELRRE